MADDGITNCANSDLAKDTTQSIPPHTELSTMANPCPMGRKSDSMWPHSEGNGAGMNEFKSSAIGDSEYYVPVNEICDAAKSLIATWQKNNCGKMSEQGPAFHATSSQNSFVSMDFVEPPRRFHRSQRDFRWTSNSIWYANSANLKKWSPLSRLAFASGMYAKWLLKRGYSPWSENER